MNTILTRPAVVAGTFYSASATDLRQDIDTYLLQPHGVAENRPSIGADHDQSPPLPNLKGLIVPHAGYIYSGAVAGIGYSQLQKLTPAPSTVYLLGPAHHAYIPLSVANYAEFATPLGAYPVDQTECQKLKEELNADFIPAADLPEHCLEVQIPFLQVVLPQAKVVPLLYGDVSPDYLATKLYPYFVQPNSFFVISSDLSHYLPYAQARLVDQQSLEIIVNQEFKRENQINACGKIGIQTLMRLAFKQDYTLHILDCRNSGDTGGGKEAVVGYASVALLSKA